MLGFTKQEQGIVLFLIFSLLVGISVQFYHRFFSEDATFEVNQNFVNAFSRKAEEINSTQFEGESELIQKKGDGVRSDNNLASKGTQLSNVKEAQTLKGSTKEEFVININSANEKELQLIPRIGPVLAKRIVQYRQENGNFNQLEELKQVKGIGNTIFKKIAPYIKVGGTSVN